VPTVLKQPSLVKNINLEQSASAWSASFPKHGHRITTAIGSIQYYLVGGFNLYEKYESQLG
jgi:hypothetical protein